MIVGTAKAIVKQAESWLGCKESNGSHRKIIDVYNSHKPLARGYKVSYTDAWCATFVSACAIKTDNTAVIPTECSCNHMIQGFKKLNEWVESDYYRPSAGDIIFYDWDDSGYGDNHYEADHVGIVEKVSGSTITVIEGNKHNAVDRRTLQVNGRYIRGYGVPKYSKDTQNTESQHTVNNKVPEVKSLPAKTKYKFTISGTTKPNKTRVFEGTVTASALNVRTWAGTEHGKTSFSPLYRGAVVDVCDSILDKSNVTWYYIKKGGRYGFVSSQYMEG